MLLTGDFEGWEELGAQSCETERREKIVQEITKWYTNILLQASESRDVWNRVLRLAINPMMARREVGQFIDFMLFSMDAHPEYRIEIDWNEKERWVLKFDAITFQYWGYFTHEIAQSGVRRKCNWRDDPATEKQKRYADKLGIFYTADITKGELSDFISAAVDEMDSGGSQAADIQESGGSQPF